MNRTLGLHRLPMIVTISTHATAVTEAARLIAVLAP